MGITNPLADHNREALLNYGPGGGAAKTERWKCDKYKDIDTDEYSFLPFIIENGGAFGSLALGFCADLRKIMQEKCCSARNNIGVSKSPDKGTRDTNYTTVDPLLVSYR